MARAKLPIWAIGLIVTTVPLGTYGWVIITRPNIYEQIADEVKKQEAADAARK